MNFVIDAELPPRLARWIGDRGHTATHVFDIGLNADDPVIWEHAGCLDLDPQRELLERSLVGLVRAAMARDIEATGAGRTPH